ncbi:MAG TPA: hypothetical protein VIM16_15920 [Mucilaginibacter sp.]|jgi:hypothetical protein
MTKRILLCLLAFFLFVTCKKEKKPAAVTYSVIGNWTLYSYQTNFGIGVNASVTQYPCMAYNTFTFYNDHTSSENYSGIDTCFITATHAQGAQYYGLPGLSSIPSTWSQTRNNLLLTYPGNPKSIPGAVSSINGKLQITFKDTITSGANTYYITAVEVKQ